MNKSSKGICGLIQNDKDYTFILKSTKFNNNKLLKKCKKKIMKILMII
jgi:hypothetical protein